MLKIIRIRVCKDGQHITTSEHNQEVEDVSQAEKSLSKRFGDNVEVFTITQEELSKEEKNFHDRYNQIIKEYKEKEDEGDLRRKLMRLDKILNESKEARKIKQSINNLLQNINLINFHYVPSGNEGNKN